MSHSSDELHDHWALLDELKRRLTEDHTVDGVRVSVAPLLGGIMHGVVRKLGPEFLVIGWEADMADDTFSTWDVYQLQEFTISETGETMRFYVCVRRAETLVDGPMPSGDYALDDRPEYHFQSEKEGLIKTFAIDYLAKADMGL